MPPRDLLVYDGDCAFCTSSVAFMEKYVKSRCDIAAWQFSDLAALGVTQERAEYELLWVTSGGQVFGGAQAVAKLLLAAPRPWRWCGAILRVPPVRWVAHVVYRLVANNRERMPGGTAACALPAAQRPGAAA